MFFWWNKNKLVPQLSERKHEEEVEKQLWWAVLTFCSWVWRQQCRFDPEEPQFNIFLVRFQMIVVDAAYQTVRIQPWIKAMDINNVFLTHKNHSSTSFYFNLTFLPMEVVDATYQTFIVQSWRPSLEVSRLQQQFYCFIVEFGVNNVIHKNQKFKIYLVWF